MPNNHTCKLLCRSTVLSQFLSGAALILSLAVFTSSASATDSQNQKAQTPPVKEWTFLLFLNGNNSLDQFGSYNINQMEEVGSTNQLNMVVQWASMSENKTDRLLIQKDSDTNTVSSKVVQSLGQTDMGDYHNLVSFIKWGAENYPAKHYMVAVWNHGNGWHLMNAGSNLHLRDISFDDNTGNKITTEQLGLAMGEAAKIIGHKVDVYGSDACLMAMGEVAAEMKDSVSYFVGSEEVEPGYGWPYNTFMARWAANPKATPKEVSIYLTEEYIKSYSSGGIYGQTDVTFSSMDLSKLGGLMDSVKALSHSLASLSSAEMSKAKSAADSTQSYTLSDYKDLGDFLAKLESTKVLMSSGVISKVKKSVLDLIVSGGGTGNFQDAKGISLWLPTQSYDLDHYHDRYSKLQFNQSTGWLDFLDVVNK